MLNLACRARPRLLTASLFFLTINSLALSLAFSSHDEMEGCEWSKRNHVLSVRAAEKDLSAAALVAGFFFKKEAAYR